MARFAVLRAVVGALVLVGFLGEAGVGVASAQSVNTTPCCIDFRDVMLSEQHMPSAAYRRTSDNRPSDPESWNRSFAQDGRPAGEASSIQTTMYFRGSAAPASDLFADLKSRYSGTDWSSGTTLTTPASWGGEAFARRRDFPEVQHVVVIVRKGQFVLRLLEIYWRPANPDRTFARMQTWLGVLDAELAKLAAVNAPASPAAAPASVPEAVPAVVAAAAPVPSLPTATATPLPAPPVENVVPELIALRDGIDTALAVSDRAAVSNAAAALQAQVVKLAVPPLTGSQNDAIAYQRTTREWAELLLGGSWQA